MPKDEGLNVRAAIIPIISSSSMGIDALRSVQSILPGTLTLMNAWDATLDALSAMIKTTPSAVGAMQGWQFLTMSASRNVQSTTSKARMGPHAS